MQITDALIRLWVSIFTNTTKSIIYTNCNGYIGSKDSSKIKRLKTLVQTVPQSHKGITLSILATFRH